MKIVIDISDDDYEYIKLLHEGLTDYQTTLKLYRAVKNGKPLPKGHGRLIDADALGNEIDTWGLNDYYKYDFLEAIDNAPTVERPHGEWLHPYVTDIACECSICHVQMPTYRFNFCPNCGADMRKEAENEK